MKKELNYLTAGILFLLVVLGFFHFLRFGYSKYLPGYDQYNHVIVIKDIQESKLSSIFGNMLIYPPDVLLGFFDIYIFLMRMIPYIFSAASLVLIYYILKQLKVRHTLFSFLYVLFSPAFLYMHVTYNNLFLPFFLLLFGILLILHDKYLISMFFLLGGFLLNPEIFFVIILLLIVFYEKYKSKTIFLPLLSLTLLEVFYILINKAFFPSSFSLFEAVKIYVADLGPGFGIGIFSVIVSGIGLIISWKNKSKHAIMYFVLILLAVNSLVYREFIVFIDLILAYYAGLALMTIVQKKWQSDLLKNYVLILILCGAIFSSGSFINKLSQSPPSKYDIWSLEWLKDNSDGGVVFSHYEYGFMIKGVSDLNSYTDKRYYKYSKDKEKINASNTIFMSRDLKKIKEFFDRNNIKYVWINPEMKQGQVWHNMDEGMLLILKNSNDFKRIYFYKDIEIWQYLS